ncbi:GDSL-type esterase/lipase family protein [Microbacterium saperdae]
MALIGKIVETKFLAPARAMKASAFEELNIAPGSTVFLGDSITEGGAWHECFPGRAVVNRGIASDTVEGVLGRLHTAVQGPPAAILLLIGTNDISWGRKDDRIIAGVAEIFTRVRAAAPEARVVLQSVMPRRPKLAERIRNLNVRYDLLAAEHSYEYLDLWPALADAEGGLKSDFTLDGLHLTGAGYRAWTDHLAASLDLLAPSAVDDGPT